MNKLSKFEARILIRSQSRNRRSFTIMASFVADRGHVGPAGGKKLLFPSFNNNSKVNVYIFDPNTCIFKVLVFLP